MPKQKNKKSKKPVVKTVRREIIVPYSSIEETQQHFLSIFKPLWTASCALFDGDTDMNAAFIRLLDICAMGWANAILCNDEKGARLAADLDYGEDSLDYQISMRVYREKLKKFPEDLIIVDETDASSYNNGKPIYDFSFDTSPLEDAIRSRQQNMPKLEDIIDKEALQRATSGVAPDKVMEVLNAELQRQMEIYNNTPQAELGGKSPNQVARERH